MPNLELRDYFAARALQGLVANQSIIAPNSQSGWDLVNCTAVSLAVDAYGFADAMLEARTMTAKAPEPPTHSKQNDLSCETGYRFVNVGEITLEPDDVLCSDAWGYKPFFDRVGKPLPKSEYGRVRRRVQDA